MNIFSITPSFTSIEWHERLPKPVCFINQFPMPSLNSPFAVRKQHYSFLTHDPFAHSSITGIINRNANNIINFTLNTLANWL